MEVTVILTTEEAESFLITAGEQGCGYWARTRTEMRHAAHKPVKIHEMGDDGKIIESHTLTIDKLNLAIGKILSAKVQISSSIAAQIAHDVEAIDSEAADAVVQVALFGEIRYG